MTDYEIQKKINESANELVEKINKMCEDYRKKLNTILKQNS